MTHDDQIICRCEEITVGEVLEAVRRGARDADAVKRMTRSGMGLCQGKTCSRLIAALLARQLKVPIGDLKSITARVPVRPVPARVLAETLDK